MTSCRVFGQDGEAATRAARLAEAWHAALQAPRSQYGVNVASPLRVGRLRGTTSGESEPAIGDCQVAPRAHDRVRRLLADPHGIRLPEAARDTTRRSNAREAGYTRPGLSGLREGARAPGEPEGLQRGLPGPALATDSGLPRSGRRAPRGGRDGDPHPAGGARTRLTTIVGEVL